MNRILPSQQRPEKSVSVYRKKQEDSKIVRLSILLLVIFLVGCFDDTLVTSLVGYDASEIVDNKTSMNATDDAVIDEIFFLHSAEARWNEYVFRLVGEIREDLNYRELYQEELDSWMANKLSWGSVEPTFREKLKSQYPQVELTEIAESLRESPSGYPEDLNQKGFGPALFNIGLALGQPLFYQLSQRLETLRKDYDATSGLGHEQLSEAKEQRDPRERLEADRLEQEFFDTRRSAQNCKDDHDCILLPYIQCLNPCSAMIANIDSHEELLSIGERYNLIDPRSRSCPRGKCGTKRRYSAICVREVCEIRREPNAGDSTMQGRE